MSIDKPLNKIFKGEIKDSLFYVATTVVTQVGNILIIPLFWRELTPTDYGIIAITEIIGGVLSVVLGLSLDQSITRFYYEWPKEEIKRRLGAIWVVNWLSSIVFGVFAVFIMSFVSRYIFPDVNYFPIIFLGLINTVLVGMTTVVFATIRIKKIPVLYFCFRLVTFVLQIGISIYYVIWLKRGLYGYFIALVISSIVVSVISASIMIRFGKPCIRNAGIIESLKFSIPIIPSALVATFTTILDRFLLKYYCSLEILGIYAIASKIASLVSVVQNALKLSYGPFFMKNIFKEDGQEVIYKMAGVYLFPLFFAGLSIVIFADKVMYCINQPSYYPAIEYVPYMAIIAIIGSLNVFYANGIILSKKTHMLIIPALIQLMSLFSGIYFMPLYKIYGIVLAKAISVVLFVGVTIYISGIVYSIKYNWSYLWIYGAMMTLGIVFNMLLGNYGLHINALISAMILILFVLISFAILRRDVLHGKPRGCT